MECNEARHDIINDYLKHYTSTTKSYLGHVKTCEECQKVNTLAEDLYQSTFLPKSGCAVFVVLFFLCIAAIGASVYIPQLQILQNFATPSSAFMVAMAVATLLSLLFCKSSAQKYTKKQRELYSYFPRDIKIKEMVQKILGLVIFLVGCALFYITCAGFMSKVAAAATRFFVVPFVFIYGISYLWGHYLHKNNSLGCILIFTFFFSFIGGGAFEYYLVDRKVMLKRIKRYKSMVMGIHEGIKPGMHLNKTLSPFPRYVRADLHQGQRRIFRLEFKHKKLLLIAGRSKYEFTKQGSQKFSKDFPKFSSLENMLSSVALKISLEIRPRGGGVEYRGYFWVHFAKDGKILSTTKPVHYPK